MKKYLPLTLLLSFFLVLFGARPVSAQYQCGNNGRQCCLQGNSPCNSPDLSCQNGFCRPTTTIVPLGNGNTVAIPAPAPIECKDEKPLNFNSDRPYQASLCGGRPITFWCGNSVVMDLGNVSVPYCDESRGRATSCPANVRKDQSIVVDLTNAEIPILGNTQKTSNNVNNSDTIDDATKVNDYVSWYLNGVDSKAEYGIDKNTADNLVNLSGPLRKLLPSIIQDAARINSISQANTMETYTPDNGGEAGPSPGPVTEPQNHNQIVVCANNGFKLMPDWLSQVLNLLGAGQVGAQIPTPCYPEAGKQPNATMVLKLKDWNGKSNLQTAINFASSTLAKIWPNTINQFLNNVADRWPLNRPPLPWSDQYGKPFATTDDYQKAYNEWRGQLCAFIDIGGKHLICINPYPIITNPYADLFPYIPLANTTDKKGAQMVTATILQAPRAELDNTSYDLIHSPVLYIPHSLEDYTLTNLLKSTFKPQDLKPSTSATDVENNSIACKVINSRTNSGDSVTFSSPPSQIMVNVHYTVKSVECSNIQENWIPDPLNPYKQISTGFTADCSSEIYATIPSISKTPYGDEIWNNTVAGSDSIFRMIYPKTGTNSPVSCIADTPAVSPITYSVNQQSSNDVSIMRVIEPDKLSVSGNGGLKGSSSVDAQLYYPHYGGVLDYFLNGIQQALRPQGYGPGNPESGQYCDSITGGDCSFDMNKIAAAIKNAATKYSVPAELLKAIFEIESADWINNPSSYQCVENEAHAAGVTQTTKSAYDYVTCDYEQLQNDIGVCSKTDGKLSRCNISDSFELAARELLWKAGKLDGCKKNGSISLSNRMEWYNSVCDYYGSFKPDNLTINYAKEIPASERRQNGDMNYCDIVCWKVGMCSGNNYPPLTNQSSGGQNNIRTPQ